MGQLFYGNSDTPIELPDRLLAHVKVVVATKLRRNESFTMSWQHADGTPGGRSTLWLQPAIPLRFVFDSPETELLDGTYLKELAHAAGSSGGMLLDLRAVPEPADTASPAAVRESVAAA